MRARLFSEAEIGKVEEDSEVREAGAMSGELGPIDIRCDAPPYPVVKACERLGFRNPRDVRWCRVNRQTIEKPRGLIPWLSAGRAPCACGQPLPGLESYTFTFASGKQTRYYLGQCRRCQTIFWDEP